MEENVALDTAKQKKFEKSIKGIKKIIKKSKTDPNVELKDGKREKRKRKERGLVYLSHIPHGFYEHAMTQYFKQFGVVTNARVIRSRRTGASRGCAFVEFRAPAVAQIVAETMNNYLMGKRLIKAVYIPPEKQRPRAMRKYWNTTHNPAAELRLKMKKAYNANKDEKGELRRAKKILDNLSRTKEVLSEMGIKYDFFVPVDVPEALADKLGAATIPVTTEAKVKPTKVKEQQKKKVKKESEPVTENKLHTKSDSGKIDIDVKKESKNEQKNLKTKNDIDIEVKKDSKKEQKNLKAKSIKPLEDFVKIQEDSEDSEGSEQFDSDEFEKMLVNEDDSSSEGEDSSLGDDNESEGDSSDDESIEDVLPPKKKTSKLVQKTPQMQQQKKGNVQQNQQPQGKRKAAQKTAAAASPKKSKFEKQVRQKPNAKQFKKK